MQPVQAVPVITGRAMRAAANPDNRYSQPAPVRPNNNAKGSLARKWDKRPGLSRVFWVAPAPPFPGGRRISG